jgi:hypothetical protein
MQLKKMVVYGLSLTGLLVGGAAHAAQQYGTLFGGNGGNAFEQVCNRGSMSGLQVRAAAEVDSIGTRCYQDSPVNSVLFGGGGGSYGISDCPGSTPLAKGIRGRSAVRVDKIGLYCTDSAKISATGIQQFGGNGGNYFSYTCGNGFSAKGLHGNTGSRVDRIGVVCSNRSESSTGL